MRVPVETRPLLFSLIVAGAIFVFDIVAGRHVTAAVAYVVLVLTSRGSTWSPFTLWLAALATVLTVAAYFLSPVERAIPELANRGLALLAVWLTALVLSRGMPAAGRRAATRERRHEQGDDTASGVDRGAAALGSERRHRVRIEAELDQAEHRYGGFFHQTFQLVALLDPSGSVEELNETMRSVGSLDRRNVSGRKVWDLPVWGAEERDRLRGAVAAAASGNFFRDDFRLERPCGDGMVVDLSLKPIRDASGRVDLVILEARDVTEHKRDQALLMQSQKMEVLGQFASGIAHDFNNLLTVIAGNLELAERRVGDNDAVSGRIARAVNAVFRGRALTDRILAFVRKQRLEPHPVGLPPLIADAVDLAKSGLDENTKIETAIAPDLWPCWADPVELQTAILNLLINARDAMPDGGRITVRASNFRSPPGIGGARPDVRDGDYVLVSVSDAGKGIPAEILDHVAEPFFTTKQPGAGSGLGLSMVQGFARQSDGDLVIESTEGQGTTVSLYLPRSPQAGRSPPEGSETSISRGAAHVLVVEDDPEARNVAFSMLLDLGYRVDRAANGDQALAQLQQGRHFDLLVTDVMMPGGKDGRELARQARSILPDLKVLYTSGHPRKAAELALPKGGHEDFMSKPYHYGELARKAAGLLSDGNGEP